ncbi:MAG: NAD(P)/FAD-dependent oxidoreductase [Bacteroidales bacterium]|nr:NAD(P)/FAD-dependent oxidoreductase [Bacteroidales bacterium]
MSEKSVIIIGSGLGGLECALLLSRAGFKVTVLEKAAAEGGCMQTFLRNGRRFDTGFHYAGGVEGVLAPYLELFGLSGLPWKKLDEDAVEELYIKGEKYCHPSGYAAFEERFAPLFGREAMRSWLDVLRRIGESMAAPFGPRDEGWFSTPALGWLRSLGGQAFADALAGAALRMPVLEGTPLYCYAQVYNSFVQGAWRLGGGGKTLTDALMTGIKKNGGIVRTSEKVQQIIVKEAVAKGVVTGRGRYEADWVISDIHPSLLTSLVPGLRKSFVGRLVNSPSGRGAFTVNLVLKQGILRYKNSSMHICKGDLQDAMMVHWYVPETGVYAPAIDLLRMVDLPSEVDYPQWKERMCREMVALAGEYVPGLEDAIEAVYSSSPLTWERYTGTPGGSAFGYVKDCRSPFAGFLSPRTPLPGLLMTGQNLNLHGLAGVSMTALYTCAEILGKQYIEDLI